MNLERLAVELRPRSNWEAVDLGATMLRAWWRPLYGAWLALLLPVAALAIAALGAWGLLLLWWLKPLFDRLALHVLSRGVFGDVPTARETLREATGLLRGDLLDSLLFHRFDACRSFHLPVRQLEGLRGRTGRARAELLDDGASGVALALTLTSLAFEAGLGVAFLVLIPVMTPDWTGVDWEWAATLWDVGDAPAWFRLVLLGVPVLSFALLEPLYVASGFALYLNRRTRLEGWDLEIAFRRLAARVRESERMHRAVEKRAQTRRSPGATALLLVALLAGLTSPTPARAQEPETAESAAEPSLEWTGPAATDPRELARAVLAGPEFAREEREVKWRLREDLFEGRDEDAPATLAGLGALLAKMGEVLLWCLAAAGLIRLAVVGLRSLGWVKPRRKKAKPEPPRIVAGLDISPESLPTDPAVVAERAWRDGRRAAALSLLYRASLATLVRRDGVPLKESDTEDDCLAAARLVLPSDSAEFLRTLTKDWLSTAYAHRPPSDEGALPLFAGWRRHFGEPS